MLKMERTASPMLFAGPAGEALHLVALKVATFD